MTEAEQTLLAKECPTEFNEPYSGREYDRHYSAMPANPYINEQVKAREAVIKAELGKLFEHPPEEMNIPENTAKNKVFRGKDHIRKILTTNEPELVGMFINKEY
jgi:hypothetical protein